MLAVSTGGRISELLSLTVGDVYQIGVKFLRFIDKTYRNRPNSYQLQLDF